MLFPTMAIASYLENVKSNNSAEFIQDMTLLTEIKRGCGSLQFLPYKSIYCIGQCHILLHREYIRIVLQYAIRVLIVLNGHRNTDVLK